ncbi:MAG TPA: RsmD family RNA methyltransferase [Actinomycetota bacterium]|nr:RsmD family RNA methyltransferase [Actinomycetota bacterium]
MRVIAGSAKGTRLAPVPAGTRPLSDRAREGVFSSLGEAVRGAAVLDLFAGTGAAGIEALSRGATRAVFVDSAPGAARTIELNLARTRLAGSGEVRRQDVRRAIRSNLGQFDLIILDPPYALPGPELDEVMGAIEGSGMAAPGGRVVLTRSTKSYTPVIPVNWLVERRLSYGDTVVFVFQLP